VIKRRGTLFVVSAPSGAGKTTLCREIRLRVPDLAYSVSVSTRARSLEDALAAGRDLLLDIDTQGAAQLRSRYPDAVLIFIMAPSVKDLELRLRERRSDAEVEIERRLARAREEIALWRQYDYLIVNRDVKEALDQLESIIMAERCRTARIDLTLPDLEVQN